MKIKIYRTTMLSVVLYGWEAWSLTLREEYSLREFLKYDPEANIWAQENRQWKRLHNEELHSLYRSLNIMRMIKSRRFRQNGGK